MGWTLAWERLSSGGHMLSGLRYIILHSLWKMELRWYHYVPLHFVIFPSRKHWTFQSLSHFLPAVTEIIYCPHIGKFNHFNLCIAPVLRDRSSIISRVFTRARCLLVVPTVMVSWKISLAFIRRQVRLNSKHWVCLVFSKNEISHH